MKLHIEGDDPATVVITYQGREYRHSTRNMRLGLSDGMPVGDVWITSEIRVFFQRSDGTIIANVRDHGEEYVLLPT
ncbi:hypothetical protein [Mycobacteroides abscessus]|uniref:hypothetical protein n=1 Tax=Mycobacteroides abscessus TaxID=36809 RepID=UPI000C26BA97|nr:hypothetical protein [Mycobacteroides abscessus]